MTYLIILELSIILTFLAWPEPFLRLLGVAMLSVMGVG